jgi:hypothetical protein
MSSYNKPVALAAFAAALMWTCGAGVARAQTVLSAPIVIRNLSGSSSSESASGAQLWLRAEVIHADAHSMVVREQDNERMIHTFTYADALQERMQQIQDAGGYQYGDKVKILYQRGQTMALKIHGRPSKPQ